MIAGVDSAVERLLADGKTAARNGDRDTARALLTQVVEQDPQNEQAWMWLSGVVNEPEEQQICLENVLVINPGNEKARKGLEYLSGKTGVVPNVPAAPQPAEPVIPLSEYTSPLSGEHFPQPEASAAPPSDPYAQASAPQVPAWLQSVEAATMPPDPIDGGTGLAADAYSTQDSLWGNLPGSTEDDPLAIWSPSGDEPATEIPAHVFDADFTGPWAATQQGADPVTSSGTSSFTFGPPSDVEPYAPFTEAQLAAGAPSAQMPDTSSPDAQPLDLGSLGPYGGAPLPSPSDLPDFKHSQQPQVEPEVEPQPQMQPWYLQGTSSGDSAARSDQYGQTRSTQLTSTGIDADPKKPVALVVCPSCAASVPETSLTCSDCGYTFFVNCPHCHELVDAGDAKAGVVEKCPYCKESIDRFHLGVAGTERALTYESQLVKSEAAADESMKRIAADEERSRRGLRLGFSWVVDLLWLVVIVSTVWALSQLPTWLQLVGQY